jgi:conjugative relaxase-like TrwC/TraI family protein
MERRTGNAQRLGEIKTENTSELTKGYGRQCMELRDQKTCLKMRRGKYPCVELHSWRAKNMLRATTSVSADGAAKYFDAALSASDYYASEHGIWDGKGAERLGLVGDVRREDFVSPASNKTAGTKEENLTVRTKDKRTAGYDFCFSVPKSVSIYVAETGDRSVERMIHESFRETMADIESRMEARVRGKGDDGTDRDYNRITGNLVYASFVHTVTRPIDGVPDPHYHIHGFTFNATFDSQENRWKAGHAKDWLSSTAEQASSKGVQYGQRLNPFYREPRRRFLGII